MEEKLLLLDKMIEKSDNIPDELKVFIAAICKGYIRHSKGMISLKGIENICNTVFVKIDENDKEFATENNFLGNTDTQVLSDGNLSHVMSYVNASNMIKLIMILTHELGHVMTEHKVNKVLENGSFPFMKRTGTYYLNSFYEDNTLKTKSCHGFRLSDGFLEAICESIFQDEIFREEIRLAGCDLEDFIYKDPRLFPSRIYDEFKDCFKLFDAILDGKLFEFACMEREDNADYTNFINENRIHLIYGYIDKTLESLWCLKKYEKFPRDEKFELLAGQYFENKKELLMVADLLSENTKNKGRINELSYAFADLSKFGNSLPFNDKELKLFSELKSGYGK